MSSRHATGDASTLFTSHLVHSGIDGDCGSDRGLPEEACEPCPNEPRQLQCDQADADPDPPSGDEVGTARSTDRCHLQVCKWVVLRFEHERICAGLIRVHRLGVVEDRHPEVVDVGHVIELNVEL